MKNVFCLIVAMLIPPTVNAQAIDLSPLVGTMEVEFVPVQSAGIRSGCTMVYRTIGRDHAYRKGELVGLVGNISYQTDDKRSNVMFGLKLGLADNLIRGDTTVTAPFFAYIQTPNGTTAKSKVIQFDSDNPGYRNFFYQLDAEVLKVYEDIVSGKLLTIGFNRKDGGIDVLIPLDLGVAESTPSSSGLTRRRSATMLSQFLACTSDVTSQVQEKLKTK